MRIGMILGALVVGFVWIAAKVVGEFTEEINPANEYKEERKDDAI